MCRSMRWTAFYSQAAPIFPRNFCARKSPIRRCWINTSTRERDRWEFQAVQDALSRGLPILAICKGLQVFNVALSGTLKLDIKGHNLPEQKHRDVQPLRSARRASHRFAKVNSAHHQAIDQLGDDLEVEAWAAHDGIIEQVRLRKYPFGLAVQFHPERSRIYDSLFDDFFARLESTKP